MKPVLMIRRSGRSEWGRWRIRSASISCGESPDPRTRSVPRWRRRWRTPFRWAADNWHLKAETVKIFQELFWKLVKLRVKPQNERMAVLIHGAANMDNIMFSYDELSGRPNQAKLVDFSRVAVSSPVVDVSYFLYSSVHPLLISEHYVALLQVGWKATLLQVQINDFHISPLCHWMEF